MCKLRDETFCRQGHNGSEAIENVSASSLCYIWTLCWWWCIRRTITQHYLHTNKSICFDWKTNEIFPQWDYTTNDNDMDDEEWMISLCASPLINCSTWLSALCCERKFTKMTHIVSFLCVTRKRESWRCGKRVHYIYSTSRMSQKGENHSTKANQPFAPFIYI